MTPPRDVSSDVTTDVASTDAAPTDSGTDTDGSAAPVDGPTIRLRGQDFSESVTLAEVYGQYLKAKGYDVEILTRGRVPHRGPRPRSRTANST